MVHQVAALISISAFYLITLVLVAVICRQAYLGCVHIDTSTSLALSVYPYTILRVFQWWPFT